MNEFSAQIFDQLDAYTPQPDRWPDWRDVKTWELGLMQVSIAAARDFAERKGFPPPTEQRVLEPDLNIEIGCWYLRQSLDHYKDSPAPLVFGLVRYNAGDARADQWLRSARARPIPPGVTVEEHCLSLVDFPKTRAYARRILKRYRGGRIWF